MNRNFQYIALLALIATISGLKAQTNDRISSLKAPSFPASMIIGSQPTSISSPKSWQAMETAIFTNFVDSSNNSIVIPDNYALEFSPYWAAKKRKIKIEEFLVPTPKQTLQQNLSLSLSSTKSYLVSDSVKTNGMGLGIRTMIWQGTKTEKDLINLTYEKFLSSARVSVKIVGLHKTIPPTTDPKKYVESLITALKQDKDNILGGFIKYDKKASTKKKLMDEWIDQFETYLLKRFGEKPFIAANAESDLDTFVDDFTKIDTTLIDMENYTSDRKGLKVEVAAALALNFPTNTIDVSYGSKYGFWITPSFQPFGEKWKWLEFTGVLRYYKYNEDFYKKYDPTSEYFSDNFDYGGKIILKWKKFTFDFEALGRTSNSILSQTKDSTGNTITISKSRTDNQLIATLTYKIDDNITLTYNFGKQFQPALNYRGNLVSVINLNFGFGAPRKNDIINQP